MACPQSTGCGHGMSTAAVGVDMGRSRLTMVRAVDMGCPRWSRLKAWAWDVHAAMVWTWDVRGQGGRGHGMSTPLRGHPMSTPSGWALTWDVHMARVWT